jgi:hypothetical protein
MQTVRIVQAVALMLIVAVAASCAATKEYSSKLFTPRNQVAQPADSTAVALKFLELDNVDPDKANWVTTDIIMGRDTNKTFALDNFAKTFPATTAKKDSVAPVIEKEEDVKPAPILTTTKPIEQPVARSYNPSEVRSKKTRTDK